VKKEVLLGWLEALKSGEYIFAKGHLRKNNSYCPLGVLCDISKQGKWVPNPYCEGEYEYIDQVKYLPEKVADWAGMSDKEKDTVPWVIMTIFDQSENIDTVIEHIEVGYKLKKRTLSDE